ncbi:MAG: enoyl-CoA hydratase-related protein [Polyangiales bacterium]
MNGVHIEDRGGARWVTLDRPDCRNALEPAVLASLTEGVTTAGDARVIVLAGAGGAFCSGADLRYAASQGPDLLERVDEHLANFQDLIRAVLRAPQPVVASVDGAAYGFGCDLALAADLRVASTRAYFQEGFVRIGLIPDGGGTWMLPRLVGLSKALELALLGEKLDAAEAQRLGLVARLCEPSELAAVTQAVVDKLVGSAPMALARIKRLMRAGLDTDFATAFSSEGKAQAECLRSEDCMEGVAAFLQKRPAQFQGK